MQRRWHRSDLDRNGNCGDFFAMVWRPSDNTVWVDADGDASFADEDAAG